MMPWIFSCGSCHIRSHVRNVYLYYIYLLLASLFIDPLLSMTVYDFSRYDSDLTPHALYY